MSRPITLKLLDSGQYKDRFDCVHDCFVLLDQVELEYTGKIIERPDGYGGVIPDPILQEIDGERRFRQWLATDFGCSATFREIGPDNETLPGGDPTRPWQRGTGDHHGGRPIIPPGEEL